MAERPILFSSPMVRAILDGRKSQTRRVVKPQPSDEFSPSSRLVVGYYPTKVDRHGEEYPGNIVYGVADDSEGYVCPYGVPGDRLWVRERALYWTGGAGGTTDVCYQDEARLPKLLEDAEWVAAIKRCNAEAAAIFGNWRWRPSIHMPRWASRLTLEVVSVRVERLNEISVTDCHAEGIQPTWDGGDYELTAFEQLWDSINAKRHPWASNPWVWVVEFKRLEAPDAR